MQQVRVTFTLYLVKIRDFFPEPHALNERVKLVHCWEKDSGDIEM